MIPPRSVPHSVRRSARSARRARVAALGIAAVAGAAVLSACGSDDDSAAAADGKLRITTLGLCNEISVYWAQDKGLFEEHGVDVELIKSTGGAAALTALQSGDIDLAFTNPFSTMIAISQGLDLKWIATAYETTAVEADGTNAVAVSEDSDVTEAADLEGATIGVNEVGGINEIITTQWMRVSGADPSTVKFVALPFNELPSSVASGKIDAAQIPRQNIDPALGLQTIGDPYVASGEGKGLVFAGYVTTGKEADAAKDAMKGFQGALIDANAQINAPENKDAKYELEAEHCKQDAAVLATLPENIYEARVDTDALTRMGRMLVDQERVDSAADPGDFVPDYVTTK